MTDIRSTDDSQIIDRRPGKKDALTTPRNNKGRGSKMLPRPTVSQTNPNPDRKDPGRNESGDRPGGYKAYKAKIQARTGLSPVKEAQTEAARTPKGSVVQEYVQQRKRARQKGYAD